MKQNNNDKDSLGIILFVLTSILIPFGVQQLNNYVLGFEFLVEYPFLQYLVICAIYIALGFLVICGKKIYKKAEIAIKNKKLLYIDTREKLMDVCEMYQFNNKTKIDKEGNLETKVINLFSLPDSNLENHSYNLLSSDEKKKDNKPKKNIIYYGFSAKKYLNWIDYVYLNFLRNVKEKLNCKIVIGLHYPDYIKECKLPDPKTNESRIDVNPNTLADEYNLIVEYFSKQVKKIIGEDVTIKREDDFYKENIKFYVEKFHNIYVSYALYYANMIGKEDGVETFSYKNYKRKLSHIESAFPTWMMSKRLKNDRIYVLDNRLSQQIWDIEPLKQIRRDNLVYFIEVADINDEYGERLNVHKEENCVNLTDSPDEFRRKIREEYSVFEKQLMLRLMDDRWLNKNKYHAPAEEDIDDTLIEVFEEIIKKFDIKVAREELPANLRREMKK